MVIRSKTGSLRPHVFLLECQFPSSFITEVEPNFVKAAMSDSRWFQAMKDEFHAFQNNHTWTLVPAISDMNIVGSKWVLRTKFNPNGFVLKHKAKLVAKGFHQTVDLDYFDTFSQVVNHFAIRVIFALAIHFNWDIQQVDINNTFLNGDLQEQVFMCQPEGFVDNKFPSHVCKLQKALYSLKQALDHGLTSCVQLYCNGVSGYSLKKGSLKSEEQRLVQKSSSRGEKRQRYILTLILL
ncbi:hypothetical protein Q3G72_008608 [Acer saccharum]|nr:hypothetical protein Q3G72_008608 [Acer saccharum]